MKQPSFSLDNFVFFKIEPAAGEIIFEKLRQSCGLYKIDESIWRKDLSTLPSPLQASDCFAVYVSGLIPSCIASINDITLDIIRKETNPKKGEPDFNRYFHYFIKDSNGTFHMSKQLQAEPHWAVVAELEKLYGETFSDNSE